MFDTNRLRTKVLDQLQPWRLYTLLRDLTTTDGRLCRSGMEYRFELAYVKLPEYDAEIHGLDPDDEPIVFQSRGREHREWFEDTGSEWRPKSTTKKVVPRAGPPVAGGEAEWLQWLSGNPDYEDAVRVLTGKSGPQNWGSLRAEADTLRYAASSLRDAQPAMAHWLATQSLNRYYAWMSQATSGGEGTAMQYEVRSELKELRELLDQLPG